MSGKSAKQIVKEIINYYKINRDGYPYELIYKLTELYDVIESIYRVSTMVELQAAIDDIGTDSGTIFIVAGTYDVETAIDIDNCGDITIYGLGDSTILKPADGVIVFNITCVRSLFMRTLKLDLSNHTAVNADTAGIYVDETNDNVCSFSDVTIIGDAVNKYGYGIELRSNNCTISQCNISYVTNGIYLITTNTHIISHNSLTYCDFSGLYMTNSDGITIVNNTVSNNDGYGIYTGASERCTISANIILSNGSFGIYLGYYDYGTVTGNIVNINSAGIVCSFMDNSTVSSNTCNSNTLVGSAGILISFSDNNAIIANTCDNNVGYGIWVKDAASNDNTIVSNSCNGNGVSDFQDSGTGTTITYYVDSTDELQDSIDSIGTGAGTIYIEASFAVATTIDIDGGGNYIIRGEGSNSKLTPSDNTTCFNITDARSVLLENFKIDATAWTVAGRDQEIIDITEAADNLVVINNVEIVGNDYGYCIEANSNNVQIKNCEITDVYYGMYLKGDNCLATENIITGTDSYGIQISGDYCMISHNTFTSCKQAIQTNASNYINIDSNAITSTGIIAGIYLFDLTGANVSNNVINGGVSASGIFVDDSNYCTIVKNMCDNNDDSSIGETGGIVLVGTSSYNHITENTCNNSQNAGAEDGYGIVITVAGCVSNIVHSNNISGNDVDYSDSGTDTVLYGDDTAYAATWNGDFGTATKNAIYDAIVAAIGAGGHDHDTDTLQLDGVNSNGGAFTFSTSGAITFNQNLSFTGAQTVDGVDISALSITNMPTAVNNWKSYATNGAGVMTEIAVGAAGTFLTGNGVAAAPSFQAQPAPIAHVHDGDTLQLDGINSNGGAFSFTTSGAVTFSQNLAFTGAQTVDGVDISAVSITNMPTAVNNWKMYATNGAGVMTELAVGAAGTFLTGNGAAAAPSFQAQPAPAAHTHDGDTLQLDGVNSNGGAFSFTTSGAVTFSQAVIIQGLATVDGLVPEADLADSIGTAALTWLDLFVQDIKDAAGNVILSNDGAGKIDALGNISAAVIMESTLVVQGLATVDGLVPEADLADSLGTAALTWLELYVQDIKDAAGNVILSNDGAGVIDALANLSCNIVFSGAQTVDGIDISAVSITNMPTAVNNWKMYATNGAGVMTELATGAANTVLTGNGVAVAPSFQAPAAPAAHTHDGDTLQLDGVNSNGGAFSFTTSGAVTFSQAVIIQGLATADGLVPEADLADSLGTAALTWLDIFVQDIKDAAGNVILSNNGAGVIDALANLSCNIVFSGAQTVDGIDISAVSITNMPTAVNNWKMYATNGAGVMTELAVGAAGTFLTGNGAAAAPSFQAQPAPAAHTHDGDTLQLDGVNSNGGAFSFTTSGAVTFSQNIAFTGAQTVDGVDISAVSITNMPTAVNNWKMYATNGAGVMTELAVGAANTVLTGNGAAAAPSFQAAATALPTHWYMVATDAELDAAIAAITAATPIDGRITVTANLTNVQATINAANCSFIIEGIGEDAQLDANGNNAVITVTACAGLTIRNLKFELTDHTAVGTPCIDINGGSNILIENCFILGDNVNSIGITIDTATKVKVLNNRITDTADGIYLNSVDNLIKGNIISSVADDGIHLGATCDNCLIMGNIIETCGDDGILIDATATDNQLSDNAISSIGGARVTDNGTNTIYGARYS